MTLREYQAQLALVERQHGPETQLYFVDVTTGERLDVQVQARVSAEGVYLEVFPVHAVQSVVTR
jgi:hypothetical protein